MDLRGPRADGEPNQFWALLDASGREVLKIKVQYGCHDAWCELPPDDFAYAMWALDNAPKLEARIKQLEAALREIAESRTTKEAAEFLGHAGAVGDLSWAYNENISIARKALEQ